MSGCKNLFANHLINLLSHKLKEWNRGYGYLIFHKLTKLTQR